MRKAEQHIRRLQHELAVVRHDRDSWKTAAQRAMRMGDGVGEKNAALEQRNRRLQAVSEEAAHVAQRLRAFHEKIDAGARW